jgi:hypothetical protein
MGQSSLNLQSKGFFSRLTKWRQNVGGRNIPPIDYTTERGSATTMRNQQNIKNGKIMAFIAHAPGSPHFLWLGFI